MNDIVELLRAGWDECCQDDLDAAADEIEMLRKRLKDLVWIGKVVHPDIESGEFSAKPIEEITNQSKE